MSCIQYAILLGRYSVLLYSRGMEYKPWLNILYKPLIIYIVGPVIPSLAPMALTNVFPEVHLLLLKYPFPKAKTGLSEKSLMQPMFESVLCAQKAKAALNGADIYAGCCTLKIEYARVTFILL